MKMHKIIKYFFYLFFILLACNIFSLYGSNSNAVRIPFSFVENKCQWPDNVIFKADIVSGCIFFEKNCLTYSFYNSDDLHNVIEVLHHPKENSENKIDDITSDDLKIRMHAYKVSFINCLNEPEIKGNDMKTEYYNYYIGNDSTRWAGNVKAFKGINYANIYKNIYLSVLEKAII